MFLQLPCAAQVAARQLQSKANNQQQRLLGRTQATNCVLRFNYVLQYSFSK